MLNLYKLDIFIQVVEAGSLSAAAERLLMSQSGVSQHIQDLERSLGVKLLTRTPRGVKLTEPGKTLYDYAQRIATLATEAEAAVMDVAQLAAGEVQLGATPGVSVYVLAVWVQSFGLRYPQLTVNVQTERSQSQNKNVALAILQGRLQEIEEQKQHDEQAANRRSQVGTGDRSEKIRTYNYPQSRVTDHRIGHSSYNLAAVMDGDIDQFIDRLSIADQSEKLAAISQE